METGSNKSLFTLIAVVVFGIFLSLSYYLFQDQLKGVLASVMDGTSEMTSTKLDYNGLIPTDEKYFSTTTNADGVSCTITAYTGTATEIVIPNEINGLPVTIIGSHFHDTRAYPSKQKLTSVILPENLVTLESFAFFNNSLTTIRMPISVETVGRESFTRNVLTQLNLGHVKLIAWSAFLSNNLEHVDIPSSVTKIESLAFVQNKLTDFYIPATVTSIGTQIFDYNPIKNIYIPKGLKSSVDSQPLFLEKSTTNIYYPNTEGVTRTFYDSSIITYY